MSRTRYTLAFDHHNMVPAPAASAVVQVVFRTEDGIFICYGTSVPSRGDSGYAIGCQFTDIGASAHSQFFLNEGSADSCNFAAVTT